MKKFVGLIAIVFGLAMTATAANESVQRFEHGGSEIYELDSEGDITAATLTTTGAITSGGALTLSAAFAPYSRTIAQLNTLAPGAVGTFVFCSDCVRSALCVSTSTAAGGWAVTASTAAAPAYTSIHCQ